MARMPGTEWIGEHGSERITRYDVLCLHTIVGFGPATAAHFSTRKDGHISQCRDTIFKSAANLNGNYRVIAVENADMPPEWNTGDGHAVPAFSPEQIEANAKILAWVHKVHGIPLRLCPDSKPTSKGLAYHRQGVDGNFGPFKYPGRVSGGEQWSAAFGKVCPGDRRIDQLPTILARAKEIAGGKEWDEMASKAEIKAAVREVIQDELRKNERKLARATLEATTQPKEK